MAIYNKMFKIKKEEETLIGFVTEERRLTKRSQENNSYRRSTGNKSSSFAYFCFSKLFGRTWPS